MCCRHDSVSTATWARDSFFFSIFFFLEIRFSLRCNLSTPPPLPLTTRPHSLLFHSCYKMQSSTGAIVEIKEQEQFLMGQKLRRHIVKLQRYAEGNETASCYLLPCRHNLLAVEAQTNMTGGRWDVFFFFPSPPIFSHA